MTIDEFLDVIAAKTEQEDLPWHLLLECRIRVPSFDSAGRNCNACPITLLAAPNVDHSCGLWQQVAADIGLTIDDARIIMDAADRRLSRAIQAGERNEQVLQLRKRLLSVVKLKELPVYDN